MTFGAWAAQAVVVVLGWAVVHWLSARRDRDKARREMLSKALDTLVVDLTELHQIARKYHVTARDESAEMVIKMSLQDITMRLVSFDALNSAGVQYLSNCRSAVLQMRRAITGDHFEDENLNPLQLGDRQLESIGATFLNAKRAVLVAKHAQFPAWASEQEKDQARK